jgi:SAM-dependent methyltransferase
MRETVKHGYEEADFPSSQSDGVELNSDYREMVEAFCETVTDGGHIVDMGCGSGVPYDRFLVEHGFDVTGVDVTETNITAARKNVPDAQYIQADFTNFDPERQFDGLICMFALFHIPREEHADTLTKFHDILESGAPLLITMGTEDVERMTADYDGADMAWSFYDADTNKELIDDAGFEIVRTELIPDDRDGHKHLWVLATA